MPRPRKQPEAAPEPPREYDPTPEQRAYADAYCAASGDVTEAARVCRLDVDAARQMTQEPWFRRACGAYWRAHGSGIAQAQLYVRDFMADAMESDDPAVRRDGLAASRIAHEHHIADRQVSAIEGMVSLAVQRTSQDRLMLEAAKRGLFRLPPIQARVMLGEVQKLYDAYAPPDDLGVFDGG